MLFGRIFFPDSNDGDEQGDDHGERFQEQKDDKVAVVFRANRVAHPRTVVVESPDAPFGDLAVFSSSRFDYFTRDAKTFPVARPKLGVIEPL